MTAGFDLRQMIRDALDTSTEANPQRVAAIVLAGIPDEHIREALALTLPRFVGDISRTSSGALSTPAAPVPPSAHRQRVTAAAARTVKKWPTTATYLSSHDREAILRERTSLGGKGKWKFLGDCTHDDLMAAAAMRRSHAAAENRSAERYEALAARVAATGAATVAALGDLDLEPQVAA